MRFEIETQLNCKQRNKPRLLQSEKKGEEKTGQTGPGLSGSHDDRSNGLAGLNRSRLRPNMHVPRDYCKDASRNVRW